MVKKWEMLYNNKALVQNYHFALCTIVVDCEGVYNEQQTEEESSVQELGALADNLSYVNAI